MPARLIFIVLALLIFAAPAGDVFAEPPPVDVAAAIYVDDEPVTAPTVNPPEVVPPRIAYSPRASETAPPTPVLAGVFRPPRPAFD